MSIYTARELPFLPGNIFRDITKSAFHKTQTLSYKNGYALPRRPTLAKPFTAENLLQRDTNLLSIQTSIHSSQKPQCAPLLEFKPAHVAYDKKVLRFYGYFQQEVLHSAEECWRVRPVVFYYYLEDDSMCVMEPEVENSGIQQGKLLKRQKVQTPVYFLSPTQTMRHMIKGLNYHIAHNAQGCDVTHIQDVLLNHSVEDDGYEEIEDDRVQRFTSPPHSHTHAVTVCSEDPDCAMG
ncbi:EF-hand domain-containing protein 1 [Bagarius yarrelli]|uniref:EF-hand domain-containing protein 1 n=1 Tax=Bagarius yarrelli TaxID=175774 RepID=A0A556U8V6_BAGYA|nr:EF-hand domain-containing protein 1 [Bagarius yarrelli]